MLFLELYTTFFQRGSLLIDSGDLQRKKKEIEWLKIFSFLPSSPRNGIAKKTTATHRLVHYIYILYSTCANITFAHRTVRTHVRKHGSTPLCVFHNDNPLKTKPSKAKRSKSLYFAWWYWTIKEKAKQIISSLINHRYGWEPIWVAITRTTWWKSDLYNFLASMPPGPRVCNKSGGDKKYLTVGT